MSLMCVYGLCLSEATLNDIVRMAIVYMSATVV